MTNAQYQRAIQVAQRNFLTGDKLTRFVRFLVEWSEIRGTDFTIDTGYNDQWARKFNDEQEYIMASGDATVALVHVDGEKKAIELLAQQLAQQNDNTKTSMTTRAKDRLRTSFESEKIPVPVEFTARKKRN